MHLDKRVSGHMLPMQLQISCNTTRLIHWLVYKQSVITLYSIEHYIYCQTQKHNDTKTVCMQTSDWSYIFSIKHETPFRMAHLISSVSLVYKPFYQIRKVESESYTVCWYINETLLYRKCSSHISLHMHITQHIKSWSGSVFTNHSWVQW